MDIFNRTYQPAYFATFQFSAVNLFRREDAQTVGVIGLPGTHDFHFVALTQGAVFNTDK
ncbi:Uncharacterised protein [Shigella sonnei]|nr:Uncharacterised protein [Shigella sonnei]CSF46933.1 Uncharacterised protein [Shigella sonnei]CSF55704.1 Uncharacterised protein [Shigella sonnei]CSF95200.1 Uncharacterised protein [Shigella sonnei]CSG01211.1 Uncharacterised protein [Shigella sonnei]